MTIGATRNFGLTPGHCVVNSKVHNPSDMTVYLASLIPVYPEEISQKDLRAKMKSVPNGVFYALLAAVGNNYLLCEDDGHYSLLRRGLKNVD